MSDAISSTTLDDQRVRVTTWTFQARGDTTGTHIHEYDYIVVPVTGGVFSVADAEGVIHEMEQNPAAPYRGEAGTEHTVTSTTVGSVAFVEIELKFQAW